MWRRRTLLFPAHVVPLKSSLRAVADFLLRRSGGGDVFNRGGGNDVPLAAGVAEQTRGRNAAFVWSTVLLLPPVDLHD